MGFFFFVIGVLVGIAVLVLLPLFIAALGVAAAIGFVIALPLIAAVLILAGIIALAPSLGYGLVIAALLIALWLSDRKRRRVPWRSGPGRLICPCSPSEQRPVVQGRVLAAHRIGNRSRKTAGTFPLAGRADQPIAADLIDTPIDLQPVIVGIAKFDRYLATCPAASGKIDLDPAPA